jgi:hypothetical protein
MTFSRKKDSVGKRRETGTDVGGKAIIFAVHKHDVFPAKNKFSRSVKLQETRWAGERGERKTILPEL